jgi:hypothetical protein
MNTTLAESDDAGGIDSQTVAIIGIFINIVLTLITCGERIFSRIGESSCITPNGTEINVKSEGVIRTSKETA